MDGLVFLKLFIQMAESLDKEKHPTETESINDKELLKEELLKEDLLDKKSLLDDEV